MEVGKKLEYKIDLKEIDKLTENMTDTKIELDKENLIKGKDILDIFQCQICWNIPIAPVQECDRCNAIFCGKCLD